MNEQHNDGGPAFPTMDAVDVAGLCSGMSLRDYFAAAALQGMLANPHRGGYCWPSRGLVAGEAFEFADAMLAARERQGGGK